MERVDRRAVVAGLGAGAISLLFAARLEAQGRGVRTTPPGLVDLRLFSLGPGMLQISIAPAGEPRPGGELGVAADSATAAPLPFAGHEQDIAWGDYRLRVRRDPLSIAAFDGDRLVQEIRFQPFSAELRFNIDGPVYGLGQGQHGFDLRGTKDDAGNGQEAPGFNRYGAHVQIPWIVSPKGWGLFVGQPIGTFEFGQTEGRMRNVDATSTRNVFLLLGRDGRAVLGQYAKLTGQPHLPPLWAFGYQQSHRTLASREEILSIPRTFREKKLPCDAVIYLGTGFCPSGWNTGFDSFAWNEKVFPDPEAMIATMHAQNVKVIVHIVPPMDLHGAMGDTGTTTAAPGHAAEYWKRHLPVSAAGVDGWWPDEGDRLDVETRALRNRLYWDGPLSRDPDRRPFALHRNGYAGIQRYGWLWSGDVVSTWDALRSQIMAGIAAGLSGIPWWGTDTGGFVPTRELTPELFVRWFQFSAFCPSFRGHGFAWKLRLPWGWDLGTAEPKEGAASLADWPAPADLHRPDVEVICRRILELRYRLMPYTYSAAMLTCRSGVPMMQALWLHWPDDAAALTTSDTFMWGNDLLVAPVHRAGDQTRAIDLPPGRWWNWWTDAPVAGGGQRTVDAPLDTIPLLVRAGAVVPIGPIRQHTQEISRTPVMLKVYPGASRRSIWYEDDGESFAYRRGDFMEVACDWDDATRTLTLTRSGERAGNRRVRVALAGGTRSRTLSLPPGVTRIRL